MNVLDHHSMCGKRIVMVLPALEHRPQRARQGGRVRRNVTRDSPRLPELTRLSRARVANVEGPARSAASVCLLCPCESGGRERQEPGESVHSNSLGPTANSA